MRSEILTALLLTTFTATSLATTIHVPDDQPTIQEGLNTATESDTVLVASGIYFENIVWPAINGIKLIGSGEEDCIIDGDSLASVIRFTWDLGGIIDTTTLISGFTIRKGRAHGSSPDDRGGGIRCSFASPSLLDLTIRDNYASDRGGGLYCETNSSATLTNVTITDNKADEGGGIYFASNSNAILENVIISNNSAHSDGGGIYCDFSNLNLVDVTISDNSAHSDGGGMRINYSSPSLSDVMISGNSATLGGGFYCSGSSPGLESVTITGNSANNYGGGIYCAQNSSPDFSAENRCNLYSNTVSHGRGFGTDLFSIECNLIVVVVDTFTVMTPTDYHASPIENFVFDILNCSDELIDDDVYVAVDGDDGNVGTSPDSPFRTITYALSRVAPNNTIHLAAGVYRPTSYGELFPIHWSSHINLSGAGIDETILDGMHSVSVMEFQSVSDATIEYLTITNGSAENGGGIYCDNSSPSFAYVTISSNSADDGGGIYCTDNSSPSFTNVTITGNSADDLGGGIFCYNNSNPSLVVVTITDNSAYDNGGGIYCIDSNPSLLDVVITGNSVGSLGGGCYISYSNPIFTDVMITDNFATVNGGGVYCTDSNPSFENTTINDNSTRMGGGICCDNSNPSLLNVRISGNNAVYDGGGIYCNYNSNLSLTHVTIADNSAGDRGGGIFCAINSNLVLANVMITANSADLHGGGIYCYLSSLNLANVTIADNEAPEGGAVYVEHNSDVTLETCLLWNNTPDEVYFSPYLLPNTITITCSDVEGGEVGIETNGNGEVFWLENNIDADPLFCDPDSSDYRLQLDSPCRTGVCGYMGYTNATCESESIPDLRISHTSLGELLLNWSPVPEAGSYYIYIAENAYGPWTLLATTAQSFYWVSYQGNIGFYHVTWEE
ncbi:MAG: DUF1565 domain-containing protein [Candidatus Delongbacteria bacterium]|nr:DUF1565 domain-containing protein [Candidatus Delongbacteria bacterium]